MQTKETIKPNLYDAVAERVIISSLLEHGNEVYHDIATSLKERDFYHPENRAVFSAIGQLITQDNVLKPSLAALLAKLNTLDTSIVKKYDLEDYLSVLMQANTSKDDYKPSLQRVARFALCRGLIERLYEAVEHVKACDAKESILQIINKAEKPISDFTESLIVADEPVNLAIELESFLESIESDQPKFRGIPTGFPLLDKALGGGLRCPGVHLEGARVKVGKSFRALNIANNITKAGIPVLYLDTELTQTIVLARWASLLSGIPIDQIEMGTFGNDKRTKEQIKKVLSEVKDTRQFTYFNIAGRTHEEWISIMRRWIMRKVGFNPDGTAKPCLIILDYLKIVSLGHMGDFKEWQYLGQIITDLHNFAIKYDIAIWSPLQLNREGINNDHQGIISGSDRIAHLCSSFSVLRNKTAEDYAADPQTNGNKKITVMFTRFGPGTRDGEYINIKADLSRACMQEGLSNITLRGTKQALVATQKPQEKDEEEEDAIDF